MTIVIRGTQFSKPTAVPIDTPALFGQRHIPSQRIDEYLKDGFNYNYWRRPFCAQLSVVEFNKWLDGLPPEVDKKQFERCIQEQDGQPIARVLWDGSHRGEIHRRVFPDRTTWEVDVYQVENMEQVHEIFYKVQEELNLRLSADTLEIHKYFSNNAEALSRARDMEKAGLCVMDHNKPEVIMPRSALHNNDVCSIGVNGFKIIKRDFAVSTIKEAVDVLRGILQKHVEQVSRLHLNQYLVYAVCHVLKDIDDQLTAPERKDLLMSAIKEWQLTTDWTVNNNDQKMALQSLHHVWAGDSLVNMSPSSAGEALENMVKVYNARQNNKWPVVLDPELAKAKRELDRAKQLARKSAKLRAA